MGSVFFWNILTLKGHFTLIAAAPGSLVRPRSENPSLSLVMTHCPRTAPRLRYKSRTQKVIQTDKFYFFDVGIADDRIAVEVKAKPAIGPNDLKGLGVFESVWKANLKRKD